MYVDNVFGTSKIYDLMSGMFTVASFSGAGKSLA